MTGPAARTAFWDEWELQALTALLALAAYACQQPRRQAAGGALAPGDQDEGHISLEQLDQCAPCTLTGDTEEGYEPLRTPPATPDGTEPSIVFPHSFEVGSAELREWLAGSGI